MTSLVSRAVANLSQSAAGMFLVLFGAAALAWGAYTFPLFWRQASIDHVATRVIEGDHFKTGALIELLPTVQATEKDDCRPDVVRSAAIIRLRLSEDTFAAGERDRIDGSLNSLRDSIRRSLGCSPADPFLWLVFFRVENTLNGFSPDHLAYLRESYRLGPNEGWIALKRNGLALAIFEQLPPDIADMALAEFASLLDSGFQREALAIFTGPGWRVRALLLERLKKVSEISREAFAYALYADGYDVDVPGIKRPDPRPWH